MDLANAQQKSAANHGTVKPGELNNSTNFINRRSRMHEFHQYTCHSTDTVNENVLPKKY